MVIEFDAEGFYLQKAEGINGKGKQCMESLSGSFRTASHIRFPISLY